MVKDQWSRLIACSFRFGRFRPFRPFRPFGPLVPLVLVFFESGRAIRPGGFGAFNRPAAGLYAFAEAVGRLTQQAGLIETAAVAGLAAGCILGLLIGRRFR